MSKDLLHLMPAILMLSILVAVSLSLVEGRLEKWRLEKAIEKANFDYRATAIMTCNEMVFFQRLLRANPDGYVFPQVPCSALILPAKLDKKNWSLAFKYIEQKRVDYAIYNNKLELLCIVELDDDDFYTPKEDAKRDAAFASAGIVTLRYRASNKMNEAQIRTQFEQLRLSKAA